MKKVIRYTANWCQPCQAYKPIFESISNEYSPGIEFKVVDVDENPEISAEHNIRSIPTTVFIVDDEIKERRTGVLRENELKEIIDSL